MIVDPHHRLLRFPGIAIAHGRYAGNPQALRNHAVGREILRVYISSLPYQKSAVLIRDTVIVPRIRTIRNDLVTACPICQNRIRIEP